MNQVIAHNVGFDAPRLTHRQYVEYLYECSVRWNAVCGGQEQALRVQSKAIEANENAYKCEVCLRAEGR
jgi:hypothetical protein